MSAPGTPRSGVRPATITHDRPIRVCVCGASGTVGSLTVHALAGSGVNLVIRAGCERSSLSSDVVNSYRSLYGGVDGSGGEGVEVVELDYQDVSSLERLLTDIDRVFVVLPWSRDIPAMFDKLLTAAKRVSVQFICKMSPASALLRQCREVNTPVPQFAADVSTQCNAMQYNAMQRTRAPTIQYSARPAVLSRQPGFSLLLCLVCCVLCAVCWLTCC